MTPGIIIQLQSIADYSNCIMTPVKTFQGNGSEGRLFNAVVLCFEFYIGTSFFINAAKEWDRRKCIDGFLDFERKVF